MAFLFVDSLAQNNSRFVQISGKILELMLLSVGLISTVIVMKEAVLPYSCELVFSSLMGFWSSITCFLSSPRIIIIMINVMVLLILASSAFYGRREPPTQNEHHQNSLLDVDDHDLSIHESPPPPPPPPPSRDVVEVTPPPPPPPRHINVVQVETTTPIRNNTTLPQGTSSHMHDVSSHVSLFPKKIIQKATLPLLSNQALIPKPHEIGKTTSSSQSTEGKAETKARPPPLEKWKDVFIENDDQENEEEDTMEATWKAITGGGKQKPEKKLLKKSETWNPPTPPTPPPPRRSVAVRRLDSEEVLPTSPKWKELRKAETFNDAVSLMRRGGLIRRDPSMSLEEFNQKVEAFIKKSNDDMRLQRQDSHQRFLASINQKISC